MNAIQFFTIYGEAVKQEQDERMISFAHLTDISAIAIADSKFYESVRKDFTNRLSFKKTVSLSNALDPTDSNTVDQINSLTMLATRLS